MRPTGVIAFADGLGELANSLCSHELAPRRGKLWLGTSLYKPLVRLLLIAWGKRGVEQRLGGVARRPPNCGVTVVHAGRESGAIVEEMELAAQADRISGAELLGEIGEHSS